MKTRPIIMSAPMVLALLGGSKTQTRRVVKDLIEDGDCDDSGRAVIVGYVPPSKCPYGKPGDLLYVRETFCTDARVDHIKPSELSKGEPIFYPGTNHVIIRGCYPLKRGRQRPGIFMPRWASRITLEITGIRVERLQDISEADARAEGLIAITKDGGNTIKYGIPDLDGLPGNDNHGWNWQDWNTDPRLAYRNLWESINGKGSWDANPFVWVIEFKPHLVNVDDFISSPALCGEYGRTE